MNSYLASKANINQSSKQYDWEITSISEVADCAFL